MFGSSLLAPVLFYADSSMFLGSNRGPTCREKTPVITTRWAEKRTATIHRNTLQKTNANRKTQNLRETNWINASIYTDQRQISVRLCQNWGQLSSSGNQSFKVCSLNSCPDCQSGTSAVDWQRGAGVADQECVQLCGRCRDPGSSATYRGRQGRHTKKGQQAGP